MKPTSRLFNYADFVLGVFIAIAAIMTIEGLTFWQAAHLTFWMSCISLVRRELFAIIWNAIANKNSPDKLVGLKLPSRLSVMVGSVKSWWRRHE